MPEISDLMWQKSDSGNTGMLLRLEGCVEYLSLGFRSRDGNPLSSPNKKGKGLRSVLLTKLIWHGLLQRDD